MFSDGTVECARKGRPSSRATASNSSKLKNLFHRPQVTPGLPKDGYPLLSIATLRLEELTMETVKLHTEAANADAVLAVHHLDFRDFFFCLTCLKYCRKLY